LIVRYHDLFPVVRPDLMRSPWHIRWHHRAIRQHSRQTVFVCNSEPTRRDLTTTYPELAAQCTTIPNMLADSMYRETRAEAVARIIGRRRSSAAGRPKSETDGFCPRYLMAVSTLEPRKNFGGLVAAFNLLKEGAASHGPWEDLKLLIVGSAAKRHPSVLSALRDPVERGDVVHLENVPVEEMRVLYSHAAAFACVSNYEGFGFPPLEAMQCGTPVIASDIGAHRWVLGDAALYCNPYDVASIAAAIERLLASRDAATLRTQLISRGHQRVERYRGDRCAQQWVDLLESLHSGHGLNECSIGEEESELRVLEQVA
jgi:glycosyltransferase involved in cell wall biosynthesis